MPNIEWLDKSGKEENPTIIIGKNNLLKIIKDEKKQRLLKDPLVKKFVSIPNLPSNKIRQIIDDLINQEKFLETPDLLRNLFKLKNKDGLQQNLQEMNSFIKTWSKILKPFTDSDLSKKIQKNTEEQMQKENELFQDPELTKDMAFRLKGQIDPKIFRRI